MAPLFETLLPGQSVSLGTFLEAANRHYYAHHQPFGEAGDFITAPDISPLFGEMLAVWLMERWQKLGEPTRFHLLEMGPGRGTLMADVLRTLTVLPPCLAAVTVHLLENSPSLMRQQQEALASFGVPPYWHQTLETLPTDAPLLFMANEFLDALPLEQALFQEGRWWQRGVMRTADGTFSYTKRPLDANAPPLPTMAAEESIIEYSPARRLFAEALHHRLRQQGGAGWWCDYGDDTKPPRLGDTVQAVRRHHAVSALDFPGEADVTAHVDFAALNSTAQDKGLETALFTQRAFLFEQGIRERLAVLLKNTTAPESRQALLEGYQRLVGLDQMGMLFKVLIVQSTPVS
jgi:NADH dehydrogenase [ubiquinone] 1 alpha subcomplex assembly factor 7